MKLKIREITLFAVLGVIMFVSKRIMEGIPNIHPLGLFVTAFTVVYRVKALYPIYVYVFLDGLFSGFSAWWIPYLYIWTILWAMVMLLPRKMPKPIATVVYMAVCGIHGLLFGLLYAPVMIPILGLGGTYAWMLNGLVFDILHLGGNLAMTVLVHPLVKLLHHLDHRQVGS